MLERAATQGSAASAANILLTPTPGRRASMSEFEPEPQAHVATIETNKVEVEKALKGQCVPTPLGTCVSASFFWQCSRGFHQIQPPVLKVVSDRSEVDFIASRLWFPVLMCVESWGVATFVYPASETCGYTQRRQWYHPALQLVAMLQIVHHIPEARKYESMRTFRLISVVITV